MKSLTMDLFIIPGIAVLLDSQYIDWFELWKDGPLQIFNKLFGHAE